MGSRNRKAKEINENKLNKANVIVLSPGPGAPKNYPITSSINTKFKSKKKIIGICLGFQQILYCEKGKIIEQNNDAGIISCLTNRVSKGNDISM